jgi:hypothetical protein
MDKSFILKSMVRVERHNQGVCIKGSISNEFEVDYYEKLEKVIKLQYHSKQNSLFIQMLLV